MSTIERPEFTARLEDCSRRIGTTEDQISTITVILDDMRQSTALLLERTKTLQEQNKVAFKRIAVVEEKVGKSDTKIAIIGVIVYLSGMAAGHLIPPGVLF